MTDKAHPAPIRGENGRLQKGSVLNPKGRPKGAKNKLSNSFFDDCYEVWQKHGKRSLLAMAEESPGEFCRLVGNMMPKEIDIVERTEAEKALQEATYDQLRQLITAANQQPGIIDVSPERTGAEGLPSEP